MSPGSQQSSHNPRTDKSNESQHVFDQPPYQIPRSDGIHVSWQAIVGLILLAPALIFAFLNKQNVTMNLVFTRIKAPLILIILCSIGVGFICALLVSWSHRRKKAKKQND